MKKLPPVPLAQEGIPYILITFILAMIVLFFSKTAGVFLTALPVFIAFFFRDPDRSLQLSEDRFYSPADGIVTSVENQFEDDLLKTKVTVVSIFLSVFDVHINRSPISGTVTYLKHTPGKFFPAFLKNAYATNENNLIMIENKKVKILVRQIAGTIARRIICYLRAGKPVTQGEKIGLIQFGSGAQLYLPLSAKVLVKPGERVWGAQTVIATL